MTARHAQGDIILAKYRVERVLGEGGMGVVLLATHLELDQLVAIKFLLPEAAERPDIVERFAREARAAARIRGAHAAKVIDVGKAADGSPFMVMEYLEGHDLGAELLKHGALPVERAVELVLQACEGLAEAHAAGIVHRDLKPANLFLARQPDGSSIVKILDFGISKMQDRDRITRTQAAMGTVYYMSPEQLTSSHDVDARSDVWAMGVVLYELLSGQVPFEGSTMPEVVGAILDSKQIPIGQRPVAVPSELARVIERCLVKDRLGRFESIAAFAAAIAPFAEHGQQRVARIGRLGGAKVLEFSGGPASLATPDGATRLDVVGDARGAALVRPADLAASAAAAPRPLTATSIAAPANHTVAPEDRAVPASTRADSTSTSGTFSNGTFSAGNGTTGAEPAATASKVPVVLAAVAVLIAAATAGVLLTRDPAPSGSTTAEATQEPTTSGLAASPGAQPPEPTPQVFPGSSLPPPVAHVSASASGAPGVPGSSGGAVVLGGPLPRPPGGPLPTVPATTPGGPAAASATPPATTAPATAAPQTVSPPVNTSSPPPPRPADNPLDLQLK